MKPSDTKDIDSTEYNRPFPINSLFMFKPYHTRTIVITEHSAKYPKGITRVSDEKCTKDPHSTYSRLEFTYLLEKSTEEGTINIKTNFRMS